MKQKDAKTLTWIIIIGVVLIAVILGFKLLNGNGNMNEAENKNMGGEMDETETLEIPPSIPDDENGMNGNRDAGITTDELAEHNSEDDCWIVYEGKVYDITNAEMHPNMAETFFGHCGNVEGFEQGAKSQHSNSDEDRVLNFGIFVGELA